MLRAQALFRALAVQFQTSQLRDFAVPATGLDPAPVTVPGRRDVSATLPDAATLLILPGHTPTTLLWRCSVPDPAPVILPDAATYLILPAPATLL